TPHAATQAVCFAVPNRLKTVGAPFFCKPHRRLSNVPEFFSPSKAIAGWSHFKAATAIILQPPTVVFSNSQRAFAVPFCSRRFEEPNLCHQSPATAQLKIACAT